MRVPPFPPSPPPPSPPPPSAFPSPQKRPLHSAFATLSTFPTCCRRFLRPRSPPKSWPDLCPCGRELPHHPSPPPPIVCPPISPPRSSSASQHSSPPPHSTRQLSAHLCSPVLSLVRPDHPLRSLNSAIGVEHGADDAYGRQRCRRSPLAASLLAAMSHRFSSVRYNSNRLYWHTMDKAEI